MNIKHNPIFNTDEIAEHYSKQDGGHTLKLFETSKEKNT